MKNLSPITDNKDITTKEYVDNGLSQKIGDAPADNKEYVRKNNSWIESTGGGGGTLTLDDYLTNAEIEEIIGSDTVWDGTVE